jgi:hypothetical protein
LKSWTGRATAQAGNKQVAACASKSRRKARRCCVRNAAPSFFGHSSATLDRLGARADPALAEITKTGLLPSGWFFLKRYL